MALNIFHEARGEGIEGQVAIAYVTHHRAKGKPDKYCSEVTRKGQFPWVRRKVGSPSGKSWEDALLIAHTFTSHPDKTHGALFYHEQAATPSWRTKMKLVAVIGRHWFYSQENTS